MRERKPNLIFLLSLSAKTSTIIAALPSKQVAQKIMAVTAKNKDHPPDAQHVSDQDPELLKNLVINGQVAAFRKLNGKAYTLCGVVVEGNKVGRRMGFPTANLDTKDASVVLPGQGVYAVMVKTDDRWFKGMANVGIRPTLDLHHVTIEAHLFDFDKDIYGENICIAFLERIRDEMKFSSLNELKGQLNRDAETAGEILSGIRWS